MWSQSENFTAVGGMGAKAILSRRAAYWISPSHGKAPPCLSGVVGKCGNGILEKSTVSRREGGG